MSRVANRPVDLPQGVTATVAAERGDDQGREGHRSTLPLGPGVTVEQEEKTLAVQVRRRRRAANAPRAPLARTSRTWCSA